MREEAKEMREEARACREQEEKIVLQAAGELEGSERGRLEEHLRECAGCAAGLEAELALVREFAEARGEDSDAGMIAGCRAELGNALDMEDEARERKGIRGWLRSLLPGGWSELRPGVTAATLVLAGFSAGVLAPRWMGKTAGTAGTAGLKGEGTGSVAGLNLNEQELKMAGVAGIQWTPGGDEAPPQVSVELDANQPVKVQGTVNNEDVKKVLLYVLDNNERFQPDVRLDSVELLKPRTEDADVTKALCRVVRTDSNAAVRLKAVDALKGARLDNAEVREALLAALGDQNPGVRIEAVNELQSLANGGELGGAGAVDALRERVASDPNNYVRLQSAALVRELGRAREESGGGRQKY